MADNTRGGQWRPYRFEPVLYPDVDFRLTYQHNGEVVAAVLTVGDLAFDFDVDEDTAEVIVTSTSLKGVPDRTPAGVDLTLADGSTVPLLRGHVTRWEQ